MLEICNVSKKYNQNEVVHGVNIKVEKGEIHGLIGSNGAGKTTLIKCLTGIYRPDGGCVIYDGESVYDHVAVKQKVAYVSDHQEFVPAYSVEGMVRFYQNFYDGFSREKFDKLNQQFGLNKKSNVASLSKGSKTKLAIMLAIASCPEYLIMDEPETGLDAESRKLFRDILIEEVDQNQMGVLLSSHNLSGIESMCDCITIMENGKVLLQESLDVLMEQTQKWNVVLSEDSALEENFRSAETDIVVHSHMGKMAEVFTFGNRDKNQELLKTLGVVEMEGKRLTLEEVYCLMKERENRKNSKSQSLNECISQDDKKQMSKRE